MRTRRKWADDPTRLLPSKGGPAVLPNAIAQAETDDYFVIALGYDDPIMAEYSHCATREDARQKLRKYRDMPEVSEAFVLRVLREGEW
jgi:hypothetical protein